VLAPSSIDQTYTSYLAFAAVGLTILLPVVSILTLTSEWSQRTALTTFTQEPRRTRVINAKVTVSLCWLVVQPCSAGWSRPQVWAWPPPRVENSTRT